MAKALAQPWTVDDFLAFEAEEAERYELVGGVVRMMTGASAAHSSQSERRMREIRTSGLMSGDGKRGDASLAQATAPVLDPTTVPCIGAPDQQ